MSESKGKSSGAPSHSLTPVMAQYHGIKAQHPGELLFFRMGDFYELFFEDAVQVSQILNIVLTKRGQHKGQPIPMCGIPYHAKDHYIKRLLDHNFRIALCEQVESSKGKKPSQLLKREVVQIITPGTLLDEHLLESRENNFLCSVAFRLEKTQILCGLAFADISTGDFFCESFPFQQLEEHLEQIRPKEILVPENFAHGDHVDPVWQPWRKALTLLPPGRFHSTNGRERLESFFQVQTMSGFGAFSDLEFGAAGALTDYILLTQKKHLLRLSPLRSLNGGEYLMMDAFTRRNLEINKDISGGAEHSLLKVIDHTVTAGGGRLLGLRLSHPLRNRDRIHNRLDSVDFFFQQPELREEVRDLFKGLPDIDRLISRISAGRTLPKDLAGIRKFLSFLPTLKRTLSSCGLPSELEQALGAMGDFSELSQVLESALEESPPPSLKEGHVIRPGFYEPLDELRDSRHQVHQELEDLQNRYIQETGVPNLKICHNKILGYYIEMPPSSGKKAPGYFQLKQSLVTCFRYSTQALQDLEEHIIYAQEEALRMEEELFLGLLDQVRSHSEALHKASGGVALLDVSSSLAHLADQFNYTRPTLDDSQEFYVQGGRHPMVERFLDSQVSYTPNQCALSESGSLLWLLTGPNMSGKSTFLRQNALIVLLAHVGSFVPATKAHMGVVDRIFSRIGASDDLSRGFSTFMMEMVETAGILNQGTSKSFIILDELGRGTSTYDGLSLAWACVEYLQSVLQSRTLFATHYHELTLLASQYPRISNHTLNTKEWNQQVAFLHEVIPGVAKRSYGIHVARLAGVPEKVIQRAEEILQRLEGTDLGEKLKKALS